MASEIIFMMGIDYPKKYPWVDQCLKAFCTTPRRSTLRLTCFGDCIGEQGQSYSSFTSEAHDHQQQRKQDGVKYMGFWLEEPEWWETCFQDLSGTSAICSTGVVTNAIKADLQWLCGPGSSTLQLRTLSKTIPIEKKFQEERAALEHAKKFQEERAAIEQQDSSCCMAWLRGRHARAPRPETTSKYQTKKICVEERQIRFRGDFAVCFVFLAHEFGDGNLMTLGEAFKIMLETVRRKVVFVLVLCDPHNHRLRSQALLLARLSGGFVVSPTHEIDLFPSKLMQLLDASLALDSLKFKDMIPDSRGLCRGLPYDEAAHCPEQARRIALQEQVITKLLEEGCYLQSRARVYSAYDEHMPVHHHLKDFVSQVMQRRGEIPLAGHPFPSIDDILAGDTPAAAASTNQSQTAMAPVQDGTGSLQNMSATDATLQCCMKKIQNMEDVIKKQASSIEQLEEKLRSEKKPATRGKRGGRRMKSKTDTLQQDDADLSSDSQEDALRQESVPDTASIWSK